MSGQGTGEGVRGVLLISLEGNEGNYIHHDYVVEISREGKRDVKLGQVDASPYLDW